MVFYGAGGREDGEDGEGLLAGGLLEGSYGRGAVRKVFVMNVGLVKERGCGGGKMQG